MYDRIPFCLHYKAYRLIAPLTTTGSAAPPSGLVSGYAPPHSLTSRIAAFLFKIFKVTLLWAEFRIVSASVVVNCFHCKHGVLSIMLSVSASFRCFCCVDAQFESASICARHVIDYRSIAGRLSNRLIGCMRSTRDRFICNGYKNLNSR